MALVAAVATLLPGGAGAAAPTPRMEIVEQRGDRVLHERLVTEGERFRLTHTHSVTRRQVVEVFSVGPGAIMMEEQRFDQFGPNLPAGPERIGGITTTFLHEEGEYRVLHHGRSLGTVPLLTGGPRVDHTVIFADGRRIRLLDFVRPGTPVEFRVRD